MNDSIRTEKPRSTRRQFLSRSAGAVALAGMGAAEAAEADGPQRGAAGRRNRVGAVAYGYNYSLALFKPFHDRPGEKFDTVQFIEATHQAGGEVAQIFHSMIAGQDQAGLERIRRRAAELDVLLEVHGGGALGKWTKFEETLRRAAVLGAKVVGCTFGMLMRPDKIATLKAWDEHTRRCEARLRELVAVARPLGITVAVENHLDFTVQELRDLVRRVDSPNVGVIFDVGNTIGTLDDPTQAADLLGPYIVATHYKDFAIEEVARGFRFTMVPLGCGSLQLPQITRQLLKHVDAEMAMSIEMINGQQFEVNWLEDRFWVPFRDKTARQVAATLRHVRGKAIDIDQYIPQTETETFTHQQHIKFEQERMTRCIAYLKGILETELRRPGA